MAFPTVQKFLAAGMLVNQRITFVSLLTTTGTYVTGTTNQAIAQGYTCAGSSNGVTAAMDGVNRCTNAAGFAVRGANTTTAQSWIVITAANGAQTLFSFTGGSDDIARISFSPGGLFIVAGTATFTPTATDEALISSTQSLIGNTASGDRLYDVWIDSAHNGWRAACFRSNALVGPLIGVELYDPSFILSPVTAPVPTWGHLHTPAVATLLGSMAAVYGLNSSGGIARFVISSVPTNVVLGGTCKSFNFSGTTFLGVVMVLNGSLFTNQPIGLYSSQASAQGDIGNRFDWHFTNELKACGELTSAKDWVLLSNNPAAGSQGGTLWPWDGVSAWVGS